MHKGTARVGPARDEVVDDEELGSGGGVAVGPGEDGWAGAAQGTGAGGVPGWVPEAARDYLDHTEKGRTIRDIARDARVHPSTVLRRVRRVEASRDDPLVDAALRQLSTRQSLVPVAEPGPRTVPARIDSAALEERALPLLRRLAEPGTLLAVARDMENGVMLRDAGGGEPHRLAVVTRALAEAMALRDWIGCADPEARIQRYGLTQAGRAMLRRAASEAMHGLAEAPAWFDQARDQPDPRLRHMRSLLADSPMWSLARRRDGEGRAFLDREQVVAGDRLREDLEAAALGSPAPDWEAVLRRPGDFASARHGGAHRADAALGRVAGALEALGPGLADVALRCCGLLEGLELVERRMGWSARSGKVVLRIALERLRRHYEDEAARGGAMIG